MKLFSCTLLCIFFLFLLASSCCPHIITITIVLPPQLTPYYLWLDDFPVWRPKPKNYPLPKEPAPNKFQDYTLRIKLSLKFTNLI